MKLRNLILGFALTTLSIAGFGQSYLSQPGISPALWNAGRL